MTLYLLGVKPENLISDLVKEILNCFKIFFCTLIDYVSSAIKWIGPKVLGNKINLDLLSKLNRIILSTS